MTKAELTATIAEKLKLPLGRAELIVDKIFDSMVEALDRGEGIEIRGFGSFSLREYKAYEGRNPRTGETVYVKPKRLAFFRVGKELRERVNAGRRRSDDARPAAVAARTATYDAVADADVVGAQAAKAP
jgi:integration host factor subunit beta